MTNKTLLVLFAIAVSLFNGHPSPFVQGMADGENSGMREGFFVKDKYEGYHNSTVDQYLMKKKGSKGKYNKSKGGKSKMIGGLFMKDNNEDYHNSAVDKYFMKKKGSKGRYSKSKGHKGKKHDKKKAKHAGAKKHWYNHNGNHKGNKSSKKTYSPTPSPSPITDDVSPK